MREGEHIPKIMRLRRIELTPNEHAVLEQIIKNGSVTFRKIKEALGLANSSSANYLIDRLIIKGYINKTSSPTNRRKVEYTINQK